MKQNDSVFVGVLLREDNKSFNEDNLFENAFYFQNIIENKSKRALENDEDFQKLSVESKELLIFCKENEELLEFKDVKIEESYIAIALKTEKPISQSKIDAFSWNSQETANVLSYVLKCKDLFEQNLSKDLLKLIQPLIGVHFLKFD